MLEADDFLDDLSAIGIGDFYGVPDSLLSPLISKIEARADTGATRIEITANEGGAIGLAIGAYLAGGQTAAVFMQNSGLGNAVNPLTSLASSKVYGVPMLLIIGWRGEMMDGQQLKDEPQHVLQGQITLPMLDLLGIPFAVIEPGMGRDAARDAADQMAQTARVQGKPAALVVRKGSFHKSKGPTPPPADLMSREDAITEALFALPDGVPVIGTTGKISREIYEVCNRRGLTTPSFLTVGGMGHASMIAAGMAMQNPINPVACFDGDGATLMQAGNLATAAKQTRLLHLVFNNRVHDSVGGQATAAPDLDLAKLAQSMGFASSRRITDRGSIGPAIALSLSVDCASFLEIMVSPGARSDLGRPKEHPADGKHAFMRSTGAFDV